MHGNVYFIEYEGNIFISKALNAAESLIMINTHIKWVSETYIQTWHQWIDRRCVCKETELKEIVLLDVIGFMCIIKHCCNMLHHMILRATVARLCSQVHPKPKLQMAVS